MTTAVAVVMVVTVTVLVAIVITMAKTVRPHILAIVATCIIAVVVVCIHYRFVSMVLAWLWPFVRIGTMAPVVPVLIVMTRLCIHAKSHEQREKNGDDSCESHI